MKQTQSGTAFRPETAQRVTDTRERAGRGRAEGGEGAGGPQFQSKQAQRSALKSNLILQFKDSTKLSSRKQQEVRKSWR